ncbi:MAG: hypothetical protein LBE38_02995 [Deltaproteobacteria bacterium]|jgi:hypothetical protein|nr:hypothetical protein [Deltaproteobacteria bacterium]
MKFTFKKLGLLSLACALIVAIFLGCGRSEKDDWESFTLLMDHFCGKNGWSATQHDFSDGALVVEGLSFTPQTINPNILGSFFADTSFSGPITIKSISITDIPKPSAMEKLLKTKDWIDQSRLLLASNLKIRGISFTAKISGSETINYSAQSYEIKQLELAKSNSSQKIPGAAGFLKALSIESWTISGVTNEFFQESKSGGVFQMGSMSLQNVDFLAPGRDPRTASFENIRSKAAEISNIKMSITDPSDNAVMSVNKIRATGIDGISKSDSFLVEGVSFIIGENNPYNSATITLESFNLEGLDFTTIYNALTLDQGEILSSLKSFNEEAALDHMTSYASLFSVPFDLTSTSLKGLKITTGEGITFSVDSVNVNGPFVANKIASISEEINNLTVSFDPSNKSSADVLESIFMQIYGQNYFTLNYKHSTTYDPQSKTYVVKVEKLELVNLGSLAADITVTGVTQNFVDDLALISFDNDNKLEDAIEKHDVGFGKFYFDYTDNSLLEDILMMYCLSEGTNPDELRGQLLFAVPLFFGELNKYINRSASDQLLNGVIDFITEPKSFAIKLNPSTPLSLSYVDTLDPNDVGQVLSAINMSISLNGSNYISILP